MFCSKCGNQIMDEAAICPNCGCPTQNYNQDNRSTYQSSAPQIYNIEKEISDAKTLGFIAIIAGIFIPLAGWICGGIGISKCNKVLSVYPNDLNANNAKKLGLIGIVVSSVIFVISIIIEVIAILMMDLL